MHRNAKFAFVLIIMLVGISMMVQAEAAGAPKIPGATIPPLSKLVVTGSSVRDPDLFIGTKGIALGKEVVMSGPGQAVPQLAYDVWLQSKNLFDAAPTLGFMTACLGGQWMPGTAPVMVWDAKTHKPYNHIGVGTAQALMTLDLVRNVLKLQYPSGGSDSVLGWDGLMKPEYAGNGAWIQSNLIPLPDSMVAVLDKFGTMSWTQATMGMYEAFRDGIAAAPSVASSARSAFTSTNTMTRPINVENRQNLTQGGPLMKLGYQYRRSGSAMLVKEMADAEQAALAAGADRSAGLKAARDEFYRGKFAKTIDQFSRDTGGYTRYSDYYAYYGKWYEQAALPHTTFMGIDFWTDVPVSQAATDIMMFNLIELCKVATGKEIWELGYMTADYIMFFVQCFDLVFADRWQYFGDPQYVDVPMELFSKEYAAERIKLVDIKKRFAVMPTPGDPRKMKNTLDGWKMWALPAKVAGSTQAFDLAEINDETVTDTTHGGMMDAAGNIFSINPSDSGPMVPGYGVAIGQRSRQFTYDPALPSCLVPGKRPCTTPCVLIGSKNGEGYLEIGTVSGDSQPMAHINILLNFLVWGMDPQVAIDQPRIYTGNYLSWFTPHIEGYYNPARITIARAAPAQMYTMLGITDDDWPPKATVDDLKARGANVSRSSWAGAGSPILTVRDPVSRTLMAGSQGFAQQNMVSWGR